MQVLIRVGKAQSLVIDLKITIQHCDVERSIMKTKIAFDLRAGDGTGDSERTVNITAGLADAATGKCFGRLHRQSVEVHSQIKGGGLYIVRTVNGNVIAAAT